MGFVFFIGGVICMVGITQLALSFIQRYEALQTLKAKVALFGIFNIGVSYLLPILTSDMFLSTEQQELYIKISKVLLVIGMLFLIGSIIALVVSLVTKKQAV
ncbi:hypothetical protein [Sulfurospirillum multivorans]|uniref:Membrane protein n=2 Tax=Sulfurospirillum multivorans TaxID=66821 RepID=A0AA86E2U6_SULMK|nr:hypothetical protein [Sulfurospirillum multivorans]AHJ13107.1 putative membrane protein [Sulfurospirillum multivorans DSM 12446]QEH06595.1 putative membrane protein [Sulfurospirillum multivorans]